MQIIPSTSTINNTFKEATEDLVSTIQDAVHADELTSKDREWLIGELDELIAGLKKAKRKHGKNGADKT